jgi:hypothetical protein
VWWFLVGCSCGNLAFRNEFAADGRHTAPGTAGAFRFEAGCQVAAPPCAHLLGCSCRGNGSGRCSCGNLAFRNVIAADGRHNPPGTAGAIRLRGGLVSTRTTCRRSPFLVKIIEESAKRAGGFVTRLDFSASRGTFRLSQPVLTASEGGFWITPFGFDPLARHLPEVRFGKC